MTAARLPWLLRVRPAFVADALKRIVGPRRVVAETSAGRFFVDPASHFGVRVLAGAYEPELERLVRARLRHGDTFVDLGANEGYFSVLASSIVGDDGFVLAVEPQTRLEPVLRANFELNGCANVALAATAVGSTDGVAVLHLMPSTNTGATSTTRPTRYPVRRERVARLALPTLFDRFGIDTCDLLKIDVEGAELEVLAGARPLLLARRIGALVIETHGAALAQRGTSASAIDALLRDAGYARVDAAASGDSLPLVVYEPVAAEVRMEGVR